MKRLILASVILFGTLSIGFANNDAPNQVNDDITASIVSQQPSLKASIGQITLTAPIDKATKFHIYSITGQIIKTITVTSGSVTVELPQGYYIVKCDNWSKQAIVR